MTGTGTRTRTRTGTGTRTGIGERMGVKTGTGTITERRVEWRESPGTYEVIVLVGPKTRHKGLH